MRWIDEVTFDSPEDSEKVRQFKIQLFLNMATTQLKAAEPGSLNLCVRLCGEAIALDETRAKAWYLRAIARIRNPSSGSVEFDDALQVWHVPSLLVDGVVESCTPPLPLAGLETSV